MCNFPGPYDNGPAQRGTHFWYMGTTSNHENGNNLWLNNKIALAPAQASINSGRVRYILSGYFGGDTNLPATSQLQMFFENGSGGSTGNSVIVGNVTPADRGNQTGLLYREKTGIIPAGTQLINLAVQTGAINPSSDYRTGYADNLSLVLIPASVYLPLASIPVTQPATANGLPSPNRRVCNAERPDPHGHLLDEQFYNELGYEVQRMNPDNTIDTICNTRPNVTYCLDPGLSQSRAQWLHLPGASEDLYLSGPRCRRWHQFGLGQRQRHHGADAPLARLPPPTAPSPARRSMSPPARPPLSGMIPSITRPGLISMWVATLIPSWSMMERDTRFPSSTRFREALP